jgi:hypothetical protein
MKALGKGSIASIVEVGLLIATIVLWIAFAALLICLLAYAAFMGMVVSGVIDSEAIAASTAAAVRVELGGTAAFSELRWTDWHIIALGLLTALVSVAGTLVIVWRLRRLFDSFRSGEPFRRDNALHLRVIWIAMVVMELSRYALMALFGVLFTMFRAPSSFGSANFTFDGDTFTTWLSILIVIVLAEVFREGARLKEEQELTI